MKSEHNGSDYVNIFEKEISDYYNQPYEDMYYDLLAIKKDKYNNNDKIIITAYNDTDEHIWKHFFKIVKFLDIPTFFIHIKTDNEKLKFYIQVFLDEQN